MWSNLTTDEIKILINICNITSFITIFFQHIYFESRIIILHNEIYIYMFVCVCVIVVYNGAPFWKMKQIYAPGLDDPSTRAFERCSSDTFEIYGPCAYQICYAYFYRSGPDGWKPESVKIYGYNSKAVTFTFNVFVPSDVWYGVNLCNNASSSYHSFGQRWYVVIIGLLFALSLVF